MCYDQSVEIQADHKTPENEYEKDVRYKIKQEFQSKMPMIEMFDNFLESKIEK